MIRSWLRRRQVRRYVRRMRRETRRLGPPAYTALRPHAVSYSGYAVGGAGGQGGSGGKNTSGVAGSPGGVAFGAGAVAYGGRGGQRGSTTTPGTASSYPRHDTAAHDNAMSAANLAIGTAVAVAVF